MAERPRYELYMADRAQGLTYTEIAKKYGVSCQAVQQACAQHMPSCFKPYTKNEVVYPHLRRWLNENEITRAEFARRLGRVPHASAISDVGKWFRDEGYPVKKTIDKIIAITGLSYEKLFEREGGEG